MKQSEMAKWLKALIIFTGLVGVVFLIFMAPNALAQLSADPTHIDYLLPWGIGILSITAVPIYISLYKAWQICTEISKNNSFCKKNSSLLRDISHLAIADSVIYVGCAISMVALGHIDVVVLLLIFLAVFIGIFIAVLTAALSHLTDKASALKKENDLTI